MIEKARASGIDVQCDRYPYTAAKTGLMSILPPWSYEGGRESTLQRLQDTKERKKIRDWILHDIYGDDYWETVMISHLHGKKNKPFEGKRLQEAA